ncbi:MAG: SusC/RagA family TonB-linked outer membrane protein [Bacteroidetes bacterium]|nr:SusC/RagA family TonB-linked outer membrane protein [Bacteroidota bacterium]
MRIKAFFLLIILSGVYATSLSQNTELTIHLKQVSLENLFDLIQQKSEFIIFYKDDQVNLSKNISVDAENLTIDQIMDQALAGMRLEYKIFDRQIIIIPRKDRNNIHKILPQLETDSQKRKVFGTVTDENGDAIPSVSVLVKGTYNGIVTDQQGKYNLEVSLNATYLIFSFVGMEIKEETLKDRTEINVTLVSGSLDVDEVIISALGIKRAEKTLTYSTQTIREEEITKTRDNNFVNSLSGKISGIEINKSAAGAGGSSKIVLRGNKSINGSNDPLFVIDGIPMANNKGSQIIMFGGNDGGDGLSQINPDDIESISILKGANAAALYGSQGANGVILITTKKGESGVTKICLSTSITFENLLETPNLQFEYGSIGGAKESWSSSKGGYENNYVDDFFQTGSSLVNTLTISGGTDRTIAYFSFSNATISGIVPQNSYGKNNITFKQSTWLFNNKLTVSSNVMMSNEITTNRNTAGYYLNPLNGLYLFPRDRDYESYAENYEVFNPERNMYLQNWFVDDHFQSNPNWIIYNQQKKDLTKRLIANVVLDWKIIDNLNLQVRGNYDYAVKSHEQQNKAGSNRTNVHENGSWIYQKYEDELIYGDAILTYNEEFGDLSMNVILGSSYQKTQYGFGVSVNTGLEGLKYANKFSFQNIENNVLVNSTLGSRLIKEAVFGNIQFGYKEMLFLEFSGRNDWASSLAGTGNESYFYPSAGFSGIVSEMIELPDIISFGKFRSSYSMVANEVPFNSVIPDHTITSTGILLNTTKPFSNLKPEIIRSLEIGTDIRFLKGKFDFDFTYYNINSKDQFIVLPAPSGSEYTQFLVNAGEIINSGFELTIIANLLKTNQFSWSTSLNYSNNRNTIVSLHPDLNNSISLSDEEGYLLIIKEGSSFGDLYVHKFLRDSEGRIKLDEKGNILKTVDKEYIGNSNPDFSLGWNNNFTYKNFSLGVLFNGKFGGKVISQTEAMLDGYGVSKRSAKARDNGGVSINAIKPDGTLVSNMDARQYYTTIGYRNGIKEPYTYNRNNIRLAQLSLSYNLNFKESLIKKATFSITGQNLFFIYKDAPFDPEITLNTLTTFQALDNFSLPSTRTVGVNLKVLF